jgi:hypothetical protein
MNQTTKPTKPTKHPLTAGQRKALAAIPELKDSVFPQVRATLPAANYIDPARFDREQEKLFRRRPMIAGLSAQIPNPSSYFQQTLLGMPVLVTRSKAKTRSKVCA